MPTLLLGRELTFGDKEQIAAIRKMEKEAEEKELREKYRCKKCDGEGEYEEECFECNGTGAITEDCKDCDGNGYIEPES